MEVPVFELRRGPPVRGLCGTVSASTPSRTFGHSIGLLAYTLLRCAHLLRIGYTRDTMSVDLEALEGPITRILTAPGTELSTISAKCVRKALVEDPKYAYLGLTPAVLKTRRDDVDQAIKRIFEHVNRGCVEGGREGTKRTGVRRWTKETKSVQCLYSLCRFALLP